MFDRHMTGRFLRLLERIDHGAITVVTPDGKKYRFEGSRPGAEADLELHDWRVARALVCFGDIGLAQTYRDGLWESSDPTRLFMFGLDNQVVLDGYVYGNILGRIASRVSSVFTRNTLAGSRRNIHAHYDLGNAFYALWLDPSMTYSSALFASPDDTLEDAQTSKYDRILNRLSSSGRLLEIGCGWGGFAARALERGDHRIKGVTISKAQQAFAAQRLGAHAEIALEDYRVQGGMYDHIVSIEMFEAVGEAFWPVYFGKIKALLAPQGKAMVQTITIDDAYFDRYRTGGDAIRSFIFPGGLLPSPSRFFQETKGAGLKVTDTFAFGKDYARTLRVWLKNFDAKVGEVTALGFDGAFIKMWRFYLMFCAAAFQNGRINVVQWELQHGE